MVGASPLWGAGSWRSAFVFNPLFLALKAGVSIVLERVADQNCLFQEFSKTAPQKKRQKLILKGKICFLRGAAQTKML